MRDDVIVLGIECWDGSDSQVESFKNGTSPTVTFPLLVKGSSVQINYQVNYDWSLVLDQQGVVQYSDESADVSAINATIDQLLLSGIDTAEETPHDFTLFQNYPNPFNPNTRIKYQVARQSNVSLTVYNMLGQEVRTLVNHKQNAGAYSVSMYANDLPSGPYFYKLVAGSYVQIRKMTLIR